MRIPDGAMHLSFLSIGQGDSTFIQTPRGAEIIIDGGTDLSPLEEIGSRFSFFQRDIDLLVLSHPHLDHLAAFPEMFKRYNVKRMLLARTAYDAPRYQAVLELLKAEGADVIFAKPGETIMVEKDVFLDVLWPKPDFEMSNVNDASVALRLRYKNHSALFAGDMEEAAEQHILALGPSLRADVLKVPHHGGRTSSSIDFLMAVAPELAVISVGNDNSYGHPHAEVLQRYSDLKIPVWRTDLQGTMELTWK